MEVAARTLGLQLQLVPAFGPEDVVSAFAAMARERAGALIVMPSPMLFGEYKRIVSLAANGRLPAMGAAREFVDLGGLMSYGVNQVDLARQTATYVDRILKGAKPAELPVEQPIKFELVINLKTARDGGGRLAESLSLGWLRTTWLNEDAVGCSYLFHKGHSTNYEDTFRAHVGVTHGQRPPWSRPSCLVAERCWDQVRWAIEEYTWRFDGLRRRAPRRRRT